jgi:glutathione-regulated potassium-efflux system ancillary protein KefC
LLGQHELHHLGFGAFQARQAAMKFRHHNKATILAVYPFYKDQQQYQSMAKRARDELNEMFARDIKALESDPDKGWD